MLDNHTHVRAYLMELKTLISKVTPDKLVKTAAATIVYCSSIHQHIIQITLNTATSVGAGCS